MKNKHVYHKAIIKEYKDRPNALEIAIDETWTILRLMVDLNKAHPHTITSDHIGEFTQDYNIMRKALISLRVKATQPDNQQQKGTKQ